MATPRSPPSSTSSLNANEGRDAAVAVGAERVTEDGQAVAAGRVDGGGQVLDERRVPGHQVGPVEDDPNQRSAGAAAGRGGLEEARRREGRRRLEPEAAQKDGVGDEAQAVLDV